MRELTYAYFGKGPNRRAPRVRRTTCTRDFRYRQWIRTLPSAVSGYRGCEAAHTRSNGGMRMKSGDESCLPLTPAEHREYHEIGKQAFELKHGICCADVAARLNEIWSRFSSNVK
jgi:hypothetical protein